MVSVGVLNELNGIDVANSRAVAVEEERVASVVGKCQQQETKRITVVKSNSSVSSHT